jgi:hypothetical protein
LDTALSAVLLPPMTRLAVAVTGVTGPPGVRERLQLAQAGRLTEEGAVSLGAELDALAGLLAPG